LWAFGTTKVLQACFFAMNDTRTPTKTAALALGMNIVLNTALMFPLRVVGLALASAISGITTAATLFYILKKRLQPFDVRPVYVSLFKIVLASIGMALVCLAVSRVSIVSRSGLLARVANPLFFILCGIASYCVFCFLMRVAELRQLWSWLIVRDPGAPRPSP
jgi:putative peptidoglycan lipid II flippase